MDYIERQREHFDSIAGKYFNERQAETSIFLKELTWSYFLENKDYLKPVAAVLEPMCGFGDGKKIIEKYVSAGISYEGFDYSQKIIDLARQQDPRINIYRMNVLNMSFKNKYDLVLIIGGLHHVYRDIDRILAGIHDALKPGGYFICYEPTNNMSLTRLIRRKIYASNPLFDPETERDFELAALNRSFRMANFTIVDQVYAGLLSYIFFYNPDAFPQLNVGGKRLVSILLNIDKLFFRNLIGRKLSFMTLTLLRKGLEIKNACKSGVS